MATISLEALRGRPIPDEVEDKPVPGVPISRLKTEGGLDLSALVVGAGAFSNQYNTDDILEGFTPVRVVRLALRYGMNAFDTSIYYGPSEVVLGNALQLIKDECPRESYHLMTKCGRNGAKSFDYSPPSIRASVLRSLERLQTSYLDTAFLHDVEFVATPVLAKTTGNHATALSEDKDAYGLAEGDESKIRGEGDEKILAAFRELQKLKEEGLVKTIGITGYPLPTLLRLALLILHNPPYKHVDVILSYSHLTLQNSTFLSFLPHFRTRAKVAQLLSASPFSMGLLSSPPPWHPAPPALREAVGKIAGNVPELALDFSTRACKAASLPLVTGFSKLEEVHLGVKAWREAQEGEKEPEKKGEKAREVFRESGFLDWSWASP